MDKTEARILINMPLPELMAMANKVKRTETKGALDICTISNAKSGLCSEDCKFCAQSARHRTGVKTYPLKTRDELMLEARRAKEIGASRFCIVTSGNALTSEDVDRIVETTKAIIKEIGIKVCGSLGKLDAGSLKKLKDAGMTRFHHNIETSEAFYPNIVSTHTFQERVDTIKAAKQAGMQVCSGGIIGMGETWDDRIDMALTLRDLGVDAVPVNVLVPIKGTPLEDAEQISCLDAVRIIAIFRIILKDKVVKLAAGRETVLKDFQAMAYMAGANGMIIGGYLTIKGRTVEEDKKLIEEVRNL